MRLYQETKANKRVNAPQPLFTAHKECAISIHEICQNYSEKGRRVRELPSIFASSLTWGMVEGD